MMIILEGIDGCGKTTQSRMLFNSLKSEGIDAVMTSDFTGTLLGTKVRKMLVAEYNKVSEKAQMLMIMAARSELIERVINPAISEGKVVICDRFYLSTYVYQVKMSGAMKEGEFSDISRLIGCFDLPRVQFVIDTPLLSSLIGHSDDGEGSVNFESRGQEFHKKCREHYLGECVNYESSLDSPIVIIDGSKGKKAVSESILDFSLGFLGHQAQGRFQRSSNTAL